MADGGDATPRLRDAILSPRCLAMAALGFASGLPYAVANETSTVLLAELSIKPATIGMLGAIASLYSFKFLWSPLVDARPFPGLGFLGHRRSWLLATQVSLAVLIASLGPLAPNAKDAPLAAFAAMLVAVAFVSATLDIVVSAWTVESFPRRELGIGSSMSVAGYRIALLVGGAAAMQCAALIGWSWAFVGLGVTMGVGTLATLMSREPAIDRPERESYSMALVAPFRDLISRLGPALLLAAAMVLLFRLPDQLGATMQKSLLLDTLGYEKAQYGYVRNGFGLAATLIGSLAGGACVARFGLVRTLVLAAVLQATSNLGFAWLAGAVTPLGGAVQPWGSAPILSLLAVGSFENLCGGAVATAFVAWLMSLCDRRYAATQYAILSGAMAFTGGIASAISGHLVERMSWPAFFALTALVGVPGVGLALLTGRVRTAGDPASERTNR